MSRIGKKPIEIKSGVSAVFNGKTVEVKGKNGMLTLDIIEGIEIDINKNILTVSGKEGSNNNAMQGTTRALINNMMIGVSEGYKKVLELIGVGYHAAISGSAITLYVGYSNPVVYNLPKDLECVTDKKGITLTISGKDNQKVGQAAAEIRSLRPPEPYKGKGIKYKDEKIRRKVGKTSGK